MTIRHDCPDCPYETDVPDARLDHLLGRHSYLVKAKGREVTWHFVHKALAILDEASDSLLQHGDSYIEQFLMQARDSLVKALPPGHPARRAYG